MMIIYKNNYLKTQIKKITEEELENIHPYLHTSMYYMIGRKLKIPRVHRHQKSNLHETCKVKFKNINGIKSPEKGFGIVILKIPKTKIIIPLW